MHTEKAVASRFLLVREYAHKRMLTLGVFKESRESRVRAYLIVVTVSADKRTIKSDVSCFHRGYYAKLGRKKIVFTNAVFFIEQTKNILLYRIVLTVGHTSKENVELLSRNKLADLLLSVTVEVGKQVVYIKLRIALVLSDAYVNRSAVAECNYSVKRQGECQPLILAYSAVVVRLEKCHTAVLVKRAGLKIYSGGINVRRHNADTVVYWFSTDGDSEKIFTAVVVVKLVTCRYFISELVLAIALCLNEGNRGLYRLALGLAVVKIFFIFLCVLKCGFGNARISLLVDSLLFIFKTFVIAHTL